MGDGCNKGSSCCPSQKSKEEPKKEEKEKKSCCHGGGCDKAKSSKEEEKKHDHAEHVHGEDCTEACSSGSKLTSDKDVQHVQVPEWKKKALKENKSDATAAPFGMNWNTEASVSATGTDGK